MTLYGYSSAGDLIKITTCLQHITLSDVSKDHVRTSTDLVNNLLTKAFESTERFKSKNQEQKKGNTNSEILLLIYRKLPPPTIALHSRTYIKIHSPQTDICVPTAAIQ